MAQQTNPDVREVTCTNCGAHTTVDVETADRGGVIECPICGDDFDVADGVELAEIPDKIWLIPDLAAGLGRDYFDRYGKIEAGVTVVPEIQVEAVEMTPPCEICGDERDDCYRLDDEPYGTPVCRDCLADHEWVADIIDCYDDLEDAEVVVR
jgi:transcription elongation factor Elf1